MPQDLLPTPKAVACATHPQCLMQCSYFGLRFVRYHWEEGWEKPLTQRQAELNIQPIQN